jgi:hypothetical protein
MSFALCNSSSEASSVEEWMERLLRGLLVVLIVDVEFSGGRKSVYLVCGGCCCIQGVDGFIVGVVGFER